MDKFNLFNNKNFLINKMNFINKNIRFILLLINLSILNFTFPQICHAYPVFAQQAYESPREATGKIVCANCHLAQKPIELKVPQAVLPDTVFETQVTIPYQKGIQQIAASGTKAPLNVGAVLIFPEGFKLAPKDRLTEDLKSKTKGVFIQPYSKVKQNILVVGPILGDKNQEITFPILSPDPAQDKNVHFLNYPVYAGGNRGRGQVYPSGEKSNNSVYTSTVGGKIMLIETPDQKKVNIDIQTQTGGIVRQTVPSGLILNVKVNDVVKVDQPITYDPNVGGFGQTETEIILQNPNRIKGMVIFFLAITITQVLLVIKKKQFEKVQAAEMNF